MIFKYVWQLVFLLSMPNIERAVGGDDETNTIKTIDDFFGDDARKFEDLCEKFEEEFGMKVCEMEGGKKRDNGNGFEDVLEALLRKGESESKKINDQGFLRGEDKELEELDKCPIEWGDDLGYSSKRLGFKKTIHLLIADKGYDKRHYRSTREALNNFNYCTQDSIHFELETTIMNTDVNDKHWMDAMYLVMQEAKEKGIDFRHTEYDIDLNEEKGGLLFNKDKIMYMIIVPDNVRFPSENGYGFALVNGGLSLIKAIEAERGGSIIHEVGHNLGLRHSGGAEGTEYGDDLCIMGDAKNNHVCFNGAKSDFLGLYMSKTAFLSVDDLGFGCNIKIDLLDANDHIFNGTSIEEKHGSYTVNFNLNTNSTRYFLMYYAEEDIVVLTVETGRNEGVMADEGVEYHFAGTSTRAFDLEEDESKVYDNFLFKRCPSSNEFATVLFSTNPSASNNDC